MSSDAMLPSRSKRGGRVAARIAWRTARRHPGRSALIVALVALPTIGLAAGTVVISSDVPTQEEELLYTLGQAEAQLFVLSPPDASLEQAPTEPRWTERDFDHETGTLLGVDPNDEPRRPAEVLPPGTRILSIVESTVTVRTDAGIDGVTLIEGDAGDPTLEGRYHLAEGRAPGGDDEVALSASALARLGAEVGGTLRITEPRAMSATIVGVVEDQQRYARDAVVFARDGAITGMPASEQPLSAQFYLPDTELDWTQVRELNGEGVVVYSRAVVENPPAPEEYRVGKTGSWTDDISSGYLSILVLAGGFALFQVCLLAGAAFVVGMRADQRALATVASVGGEPRLVSRIVSMGGVVLGAIGGIIGVGLGVLAGWGYLAIIDDGSSVTFPGFHPWPAPLAIVLTIAVLAGWIAALTAARSARRIDVVSALRGARRPYPARRRRAVAGVAVVIVGAVLLAVGGILAVLSYWPDYRMELVWLSMGVLVLGAIGLQLGLVLTTPALLRGISRLLSRVSEGARLASRDASRNHARSVPAAAAVMSTVFVASFVMTFLASGQKGVDESWTYEGPVGTVSGSLVPFNGGEPRTFATAEQADRMEQLLRGALGTDEVAVLDAVLDPLNWGMADSSEDALWTTPRAHGEPECRASGQALTNNCVQTFPDEFGRNEHLYVGDADDLAMILGRDPDAEAVRMLEAGGAVAFWSRYVHDGELTLDTWTTQQARDGIRRPDAAPVRSDAVPAVFVDPGYQLYFGVLVSNDAADELGLDYGAARIMAVTGERPTDQEYQALWAGMSTILPNTSAYYEAGPPQYGETWSWALLGLTALIAFAAASVAIGLARADGRRDDEVLDAIGAPPRLRRSVAFWQAIVIAGVGTVLGAIVGVLPVLALALATQLAQAQGGWTGGGPLQDFAPPWLQLGLTVVGVPLAIALGSWATASRRRVAVRRAA